MRALASSVAVLAAAAALAGCPARKSDVTAGRADAAAAPDPTLTTASAGDPARGHDLLATYECNRCHEGAAQQPVATAKHCVQCHKDIVEDRFSATAAAITKWKPRVRDLTEAPSLESTGARLKRSWVEGYLLAPTDLRPHLAQYMPRLALTPADARDIAAYLVPQADPPVDVASAPELANADLGKGRQLLETKGCGSCHTMSGVAALAASTPPKMDGKDFKIAFTLAPDLRTVRDRMTPAKLAAWLTDPKAVKHDTKMPTIALSPAEIRDVSGYLFTAELAPVASAPARERLPLLTRKVTYREVDDKVLHRTCWHCHSEPDFAIGDGGPGNSGGFGFKPRGLNLASYEAVASGYLDDHDERQNVFAKDAAGVPLLVRAMLARHDETGRNAVSDVRGMPLGYAPVPLEDIQLVDTWIAQGRPR